MRIVIPAAGIGTRLRPHTHTIPKSLLHVAGKPILGHILDGLVTLNPEETVIVTGFMGDKVRDYVLGHYPLNSSFVQQEELLGLGYAIYLALAGRENTPTMIILGDTIVQTDFKAFVSSGENALGLMPVDDPQRFGIAEVANGHVVNLVEKPIQPKSNMAVIGLYYVHDSAVLADHLGRLLANDKRTKGEIQLTDALQGMIADGVVFAPFAVDNWYDCGQRETLIDTNRYLLEKMALPSSREGSVIIPPAFIAPRAVVEESIIGPYVSISDQAVVKRSIIRNSIIGYEAEVNNALLTDSLIGHRAIVFGNLRTMNVGDSSEIGYF